MGFHQPEFGRVKNWCRFKLRYLSLKTAGSSVLLAIVNPKRRARTKWTRKNGWYNLPEDRDFTWLYQQIWHPPGRGHKSTRNSPPSAADSKKKLRLEALEEERIPDPQHRGDRQTLGKPGDEPLRANGHQIHIQPQQLLAFQSCDQLGRADKFGQRWPSKGSVNEHQLKSTALKSKMSKKWMCKHQSERERENKTEGWI